MEPAQGDSTSDPWLFPLIRRYKLPCMLLGMSLLCMGAAIFLLVRSVQSTTPIEFSSSMSESDNTEESQSVVEVVGGVVRPGVYQVPSSTRVGEVIEKAGGLSEEADEDSVAKVINRAAVVTDGMKVYIKKKDMTSHNVSSTTTILGDTTNSAVQETDAVSVNYASISELDRLPGVGPVTAQKIIDNRPYGQLEELVTKNAVGQKAFEKIRDKLSL